MTMSHDSVVCLCDHVVCLFEKGGTPHRLYYFHPQNIGHTKHFYKSYFDTSNAWKTIKYKTKAQKDSEMLYWCKKFRTPSLGSLTQHLVNCHDTDDTFVTLMDTAINIAFAAEMSTIYSPLMDESLEKYTPLMV